MSALSEHPFRSKKTKTAMWLYPEINYYVLCLTVYSIPFPLLLLVPIFTVSVKRKSTDSSTYIQDSLGISTFYIFYITATPPSPLFLYSSGV